MKQIPLCNEQYMYLSDHNRIVNREFMELFLKHRTNPLPHRESVLNRDHILSHLRKLNQIILEVTQSCNLQCRYCTFSDHYQTFRMPSQQVMSFETAQKALELVFAHIGQRENREFVVGFYGGEPMLQFPLVRRITEFAHELFAGWTLRHTITTNATLLTDEILDFLEKYDFGVLVSLDGPPQNHDAKRVFHDGRGTYAEVREKLEHIRRTRPEFFEKKVRYSAVFSKDLCYLDTVEFFRNDDLVNHAHVNLSFVNEKDTDYYRHFPYDRDAFLQSYKNVFRDIREKAERGEELKPVENTLFNNFNRIRKQLQTGTFAPLDGTCLYDSRFYVAADGSFHICEKINNLFSFGNVRQGFDFARMEQLAAEYAAVVQEKCSTCEVRFLCMHCFIHFAGDRRFVISDDYCQSQKGALKRQMEVLLEMENRRARPVADGDYHFHPLVLFVPGPANTAIIDLLKGNVFQVENAVLEKFRRGEYEAVPEFIAAIREEELLLPQATVAAPVPLDFSDDREELPQYDLEIEEGADLKLIEQKFSRQDLMRVIHYHSEFPPHIFPGVPLVKAEKDLEECRKACTITGEFSCIDETRYRFQQAYNPCWGNKLAITADNMVRPCIHSDIVLGDLRNDKVFDIVEKAKEYWHFTKDKVEGCRECELRHVCFDCRELARRAAGGRLDAPNPYCRYRPQTGVWETEEETKSNP